MPAMGGQIDVGSVIDGKYRVDRRLGEGGMGLVLAVTHLDLLESRAIKLIHPHLVEHPEITQRLLQEARTAARLRSPHVAKVYDVGRLDDGTPFLVMEYLDGVDLSAVQKKRGTFAPSDAVLYAIQICDALAEAHELGVIHRDLKPENLLLTHDRDGAPSIKVLDFGISKIITPSGPDKAITSTGRIMGTPVFMPPEQMQGAPDIDARADIWALGVILYGMLTGRYPFEDANPMKIMSRVLATNELPRPPWELRQGLSRELGAVVLRCLSRSRDERFASALDLARALLPFGPDSAGPLVQRMARAAERQHVPDAQPATPAVTSAFSMPPSATVLDFSLDQEARWRRRRVPLIAGAIAAAVTLGGLFAARSPQPPLASEEEAASSAPSASAAASSSAPSASATALSSAPPPPERSVSSSPLRAVPPVTTAASPRSASTAAVKSTKAPPKASPSRPRQPNRHTF